MIISDLKRFWWLSVIHTLALLLIIPFQQLSMLSEIKLNSGNKATIIDSMIHSLEMESRSQILLICIIPVATAVLLFCYMHSERSASMMHSLPCTRMTHYLSHMITGLMMITVPVIFTGLVQLIIYGITDIKSYYSVSFIFLWIGRTLIFNILFYASAVFVGMFTGNAIAHIVFTYILHILPYETYYVLRYTLSKFVYGFSSDISSEIIDNLPVITLLGRRSGEGINLIIYIVVAIILLIMAYFIYRIRKRSCR